MLSFLIASLIIYLFFAGVGWVGLIIGVIIGLLYYLLTYNTKDRKKEREARKKERQDIKEFLEKQDKLVDNILNKKDQK